MANEHDLPNNQLSLPTSWSNDLNTFALPQIMGRSTCENTTRQLPALAMPQWPSMLANQSYTEFQFTNPQTKRSVQAQTTTPLPTPVSTIPVVPSSTSRKTLTDLDPEKICQYAGDNPSAKQSEIGAHFGVQRSTVSKVLGRKKRNLPSRDEDGHKSTKRPKNQPPDVERTLAVWAEKQESQGRVLSDDDIRQKAEAFLAASKNPEASFNDEWIASFKTKNNLKGAKYIEDSLANESDDPSSMASSLSTPDIGDPNKHLITSMSSVQALAEPHPNLNSAPPGVVDDSQPPMVPPPDMMRLCLLSSNNDPHGLLSPASPWKLSLTSLEEARKAMEIVVNFLEQQPNGYLEMQDSITVGKLMEKLESQARDG